MDILGVSCYFHDAAAVLLRDGHIVAGAEEERFTRKKHDYNFPEHAITFCLSQGHITGHDLDYVVFFEKPFVKFERLLLSILQTFPRSHRVFQDSMITWMQEKLWIKNIMKEKLGVCDKRVLFAEHHVSHAASAYLCSPFSEAALLTVDGVGEWATASYGVGRGTEISLSHEIHFPHSLGLLYSAFTAFLGFEVNEGEYKVMGMAPFGVPRYQDRVRELIQVASDGSFRLNMEYFSFHYSTHSTYARKFLELFGPPRDPETPFFTSTSGFPSYFGERPANYEALAQQNQYYADIAASIQQVTEETLLTMAYHVHRETGLTKLCLAGGVALNSVANSRLLRESPFEELYIQPAAGDAGGALGAALWAYHSVLGHPRKNVMDHAFWGEAHDDGQIERFLQNHQIPFLRIEDDDTLIDRVVEALCQGQVIGWYQGRFEWGPRALGNRSILADPRRGDMKDRVNTKIKFREPFRPFAPSVLMERTHEYFDLPDPMKHFPARFMLYVLPVLEGQRQRIPAVTHVDGTGRVQMVDPTSNLRYYRLIERFGQVTGIPLLLNTSFNLKGEPIVNTPQDAFSSFSRSDLDLLVLGHCLLDRNALEGHAPL